MCRSPEGIVSFPSQRVEVKKSYKADLDNQRAFNFLLGLVVVLSLFLVALEFTTTGGVSEDGDDLLDDVSHDVEMMPVVDRNAVAAMAAGHKQSGESGKVSIVDKPSETLTAEPQAGKGSVPGNLWGMGGVTDISNAAIPTFTAVPLDKQDNPLNFQVVERLPEYPGGMSAFVQWLTKNLKYPVTAQRRKVEGTVLVAFIVNKDGSITDLKVVKSAAPELDSEALRVLRMMPKWKPGEDRGKPCRTYFSIPVVFKL